VVISPHLDDGVLACGQLLAAHPASTVITVFAGRPPEGTPLTEWDAAASFRPGDDVIAARREEDRCALAVLGARPVWLDFCDAQYSQSPTTSALAACLEAAIGETGMTTVYIPLGLFHSDHQLVRAALLRMMHRLPRYSWFAYEEPNYRRIPNLLQQCLAALQDAGMLAGSVGSSSAQGRAEKRRAVEHYRSQLRALSSSGRPGDADVFAAERYWRLEAGGCK
jgi:LmbE family N-acetylglucosaminyl deacetylase